MAGVTYFVQACPTCGRRLQVRTDYLGKHVACRHCGRQFEAHDPSMPVSASLDHESALLARVDELLEASRATFGSRCDHSGPRIPISQ